MAAILDALDCSENDYTALFALCLLHAIGHNKGINSELLDTVLLPCGEQARRKYNSQLAELIISIVAASCLPNSRVRLVTLELALLVLKQLVLTSVGSVLSDADLARVEGAREQATLTLRNFYKSEEIFLDIFEDEYREMKKRPVNVEYLMMDDKLLLPPAGTPMSGVEFSRRLPCGEVERARCAIRVFLLLRDTSLTLRGEPDSQLPLQRPDQFIGVDETLDLNNSDLIACTVTGRDGGRRRRFLVIDVLQLLLVDPDPRRLGWGLAKFAGALQDVEVTGDKEDSRVLHVTVHGPAAGKAAAAAPLLSAKFVFDDHIRCMAAKQKLVRGRQKARQRKMYAIGRLLELPGHLHPCPSPPSAALSRLRPDQARRAGSRPGSAAPALRPLLSAPAARSRRETSPAAAAGAGAAAADEIALESIAKTVPAPSWRRSVTPEPAVEAATALPTVVSSPAAISTSAAAAAAASPTEAEAEAETETSFSAKVPASVSGDLFSDCRHLPIPAAAAEEARQRKTEEAPTVARHLSREGGSRSAPDLPEKGSTR